MKRAVCPSSVPLLFTLMVGVAACSSSSTRDDRGSGSLALALTLANGVEITQVEWEITGGDMDPMSGSINVSAPGSTASIEVFGLPPADDDEYTISLQAQSTDEESSCQGSANFGIDVGTVTEVMVMLNCKSPQRLGAVRANGKFNVCAELAKVVVSPLQTSVSNDIDLSSLAIDVEGDEVAYRWSATGGSIAAPDAADTTYTCEEVGPQSVTIEVSDDAFEQCVASWTVAVTCVSNDNTFDLRITEIWPGNDPGENLTDDWFEIVNIGDVAWVSGVDGDLYYDDESQDPTAADLISGITDIQPGEAVLVLITEESDGVQQFLDVWAPVYELDGIEIGTVDGAGLGGGGDAVSLFVGPPSVETLVDFQSYPEADPFGGQSWDVAIQAFSEVGVPPLAIATAIVNDADQPAIGSPGDQGPVQIIGNPPVITLNPPNPLVLELNEPYVDPGATAFDQEDGNITDQIVVGGDTVDTSVYAEYFVTYDVTDSDGNAATTVTRTVVVTFAETIPAAPEPSDPGFFSFVSTLGGLVGAEIAAYDASSQRASVPSDDGLEIVDLSNPATPSIVGSVDPTEPPFNLDNSAVTSVDVCGETVAFAVPAEPQTDDGALVLTDTNGDLIAIVTVGPLPDMVTFDGTCALVLTANEGEPEDGVDPEGSVSIVDVATGVVSTADFTAFNGQEEELREAGVRLFPGVPVANDLEPEYIAVSPDDSLAYVSLQENNALALVDIPNATVTDILALGLKDHSAAGNTLDTSDVDGVLNFASRPVFGMYMPDGIASYEGPGSVPYYVTANEGDARNEDVRVATLELDPSAFPNAEAEQLQNDFVMGRLQVSEIDGDPNGDGIYEQLQSYGARSFSIWDGSGQQVYDSGSDLGAIVATYARDSFDDGRSDNKGVEPEGVVVGRVDDRAYAFIGLERAATVTGLVVIYDVTDPADPVFVQLLQTEGDEAPEGLDFVALDQSPNSCPTLLIANEGTSTLTVYQQADCAAAAP